MTIRKRPDLKLLIASATLDAKKFSKYFNNAPVFEIPGRTFPVDIEYQGDPGQDYENACVSTVMRIHRFEKEGKEEIQTLIKPRVIKMISKLYLYE